MKKYTTLKDETIDLTTLSSEELAVYKRVRRLFNQNPPPPWDEFETFWLKEMSRLEATMSRKEVTASPIWRICEDLDSRLAIEQGYARKADYIDDLRELIASKYQSRYSFCRSVGVDEGYLSRVLNRKQHISLKKLQQILDKLDAHLVIRHKGAATP